MAMTSSGGGGGGGGGTADTTNALESATSTVNVSAATAPTNGQVLKATSGTAATWQTPAASSTTDAVESATTTVNLSSATAPSASQILTATGSTAATWQAPAVVKLDDAGAPDDNTDLDASASAHGLLPKLSNVELQHLNGVGSWAYPSNVVYEVRKGSVGTITKGAPVYQSGWNAGGWIEVEEADADAAATMPCIGLANESITNAALSEVIAYGTITGTDTSAFTVLDALYVSGTTGTLTATKPAGTALIQKIGIATRIHASLGVIQVIGAGRTNDVPNIPDGELWIGDGSGVATATGKGSITGIGSANALASATTTVNTSSATAPTTGQVLTATGDSAATWQAASGGLVNIEDGTGNDAKMTAGGGNFLPESTTSSDLGSAAKMWDWVYTENIHVDELIRIDGISGGNLQFQRTNELITIAAAAYSDSSANLFGIYKMVFAVGIFSDVAIPTATTYNVGIPGDPARYGKDISDSAGTRIHQIYTPPIVYDTNYKCRITPNATPSGATGRVRVAVYYCSMAAPST